MSYNYRNRENVKNVLSEVFLSFLFKEVYFDVQNSNPMFIFICRDRKTPIIGKNRFCRVIENIRYGGKVSLRQAAIGLTQRLQRFTLSQTACNWLYGAVQSSVWSRKIDQLHPFCGRR